MANFYTKKIENCMDCDNHKVERIWTPDSWEHVEVNEEYSITFPSTEFELVMRRKQVDV